MCLNFSERRLFVNYFYINHFVKISAVLASGFYFTAVTYSEQPNFTFLINCEFVKDWKIQIQPFRFYFSTPEPGKNVCFLKILKLFAVQLSNKKIMTRNTASNHGKSSPSQSIHSHPIKVIKSRQWYNLEQLATKERTRHVLYRNTLY